MRSLRVVHQGRFDVVVDLMDGDVPERCWQSVNEGGILISVDSASFYFVEVHVKRELRRDGVEALSLFLREVGRSWVRDGDRAVAVIRYCQFCLTTSLVGGLWPRGRLCLLF